MKKMKMDEKNLNFHPFFYILIKSIIYGKQGTKISIGG